MEEKELIINKILKIQQKKNITILAPYNVYPARTGGKKFIALFHQYLAKVLPVEFISVSDNDMPIAFQKSFHGVLGNSKFRYANPFLFFKLRKIIKQKKITDLIIVHPYFGWLAWLLKKNTGISLSLLSHNIESVRFKSMGKSWWRLLWFYEKNTHKIIDNNFFVTEEDLEFAVQNYTLNRKKCFVITYGIEWQKCPEMHKKIEAARVLRQQYKIADNEKILLFNGSLDYAPNIEAVNYIIENINPILLKEPHFKYKIIICGKGLPASFNELKEYINENIIYAGYVDDINLFFKGSDIFLNPVITGGGIKTKLVEALGNSVTSISSESGSFGIPKEIVKDKLHIVKNYDWDAFASAILVANIDATIDASFFNHFYWGNIAAKAAQILTSSEIIKE
jgi:polysaccharide biosynthesis protein PslH